MSVFLTDLNAFCFCFRFTTRSEVNYFNPWTATVDLRLIFYLHIQMQRHVCLLSYPKVHLKSFNTNSAKSNSVAILVHCF